MKDSVETNVAIGADYFRVLLNYNGAFSPSIHAHLDKWKAR